MQRFDLSLCCLSVCLQGYKGDDKYYEKKDDVSTCCCCCHEPSHAQRNYALLQPCAQF